MSWMNMLYQTYENNKGMAGKPGEDVTLSVIAHMTANTQLEIILDSEGNFLDAVKIEKDMAKTLIPVTESSSGRSSGIAPHPLSDTLSYIAADYADYESDEKLAQKAQDKYQRYITGLKRWAESEYATEKVKVIYKYLLGGTVISDLLKRDIVSCDTNGKMDKNKIVGQPYEKVMVRFRIISGEANVSTGTWEDSDLLESYTKYYLQTQAGEKNICFLTGKEEVISSNHPKGILSACYGAKLISANDNKGFTYRGRFSEPEEACTISYEASQKVHAALIWLAQKQGVQIGTQDKRTYICWNPTGKKTPNIWDPLAEFEEGQDVIDYTEAAYRSRLRKALNGEFSELAEADDIVVIGLDAATTGRLSVTYYSELKASVFRDRIEDWHSHCNWFFWKNYNGKSELSVMTPYIQQIVKYAFGTEQGAYIGLNDKILKEQVQRIIHCIVDAKDLPKDIMNAIITKTKNPLAYSSNNFEKVLATACALIKLYAYQKRKEVIEMELDIKNSDRSYLFGRLLAVCEKVESQALYKSGEKRKTNAERLWAEFTNHPFHTWLILENALQPYYQKLSGGEVSRYKNIIGDITEQIVKYDSSELNRSLSENFLLGYYLQRNALWTKESKTIDDNREE